MGKGVIDTVTKEHVLRIALSGACKIPKVGERISNYSQSDLLWAEKCFTDKEKQNFKLPLWILSGYGGYGYGSYGDGGYGDGGYGGYGDGGYGDGYGGYGGYGGGYGGYGGEGYGSDGDGLKNFEKVLNETPELREVKGG